MTGEMRIRVFRRGEDLVVSVPREMESEMTTQLRNQGFPANVWLLQESAVAEVAQVVLQAVSTTVEVANLTIALKAFARRYQDVGRSFRLETRKGVLELTGPSDEVIIEAIRGLLDD